MKTKDEEYPYQKDWEHYRWLVRIFSATILSLPFFIILLTIKNWAVIEKTLAVTGILILITNSIIYLNIIVWKCPRCGNLYFRWWNRNAIFSKKCRSCGLTKYKGSGIKGFLSK